MQLRRIRPSASALPEINAATAASESVCGKMSIGFELSVPYMEQKFGSLYQMEKLKERFAVSVSAGNAGCWSSVGHYVCCARVGWQPNDVLGID